MSLDYMQIRQQVRKLDPWKQAVFALACAEHVGPLVRHLASAASKNIFEQVMLSAWRALSEHNRDVAAMIQVVNALPEFPEEDSDLPEHDVALALGILEHALDAIGGPDPADSADCAGCLACDMYSSIDGRLFPEPSRPRSPSDPEPLGPWKMHEKRCQAEIVHVLRCASGSPAVICERIRERAEWGSAQMAAIVPDYVRRHGWHR